MIYAYVKRYLWLLCIVALVLGYGCNQKPLEQKTLSIVVREGLEAEGLRRVAEEWERLRGVKVFVEALGRSNYEFVTKKTLKESRPKYDVVFFPGTQVAEMAAKGALAPIEQWTPEDDKDLMAYSSYKDKVYGLPCDISTFFTFYRKDIFESVPESWQDLLSECQKWSTRTTSKVGTTFGLAFAGQPGEDLPKIFYPLLWSYGGFIIKDGQVGIDSKEAVEAANMLRELAISPAVPPEIQTWNIIRILDELRAGTVAISTPQWNALYPLIKESKDQIAKNIEIAHLPGFRQADGSIRRVNFMHTWVLVKPSRTNKSRLANDFILFATGREGARSYAETARGNPARRSILSDKELQQKRPEFKLMLECIKLARSEPEVTYYSELHEIMNNALSKVISGSKSPHDAMKEAAILIRELVRSHEMK